MAKKPSPFLKAALAFANGSRQMDKNAINGLDSVAQRVLKTAKQNAPVLTGALRASGRVRRLNQFRRAIEFGGRGSGVDYSLAVEFGTFRTAPRFFLTKALMKNKVHIKKALSRKVEKTLNQISKAGGSIR
jgi:HK97 gp10 family phage protein